MEQRDYLLRQTEQLGLVLGKILSKLLNLKGNDTITIGAINQIFTDELGFDIAQLYTIDNDKWIDTLKNEKNFDNGNLEKLADIFLLIAENINICESNQLYQKGLIIYRDIEKSECTYSFERNQKIKKIECLINPMT